jgi:hypothetical protein
VFSLWNKIAPLLALTLAVGLLAEPAQAEPEAAVEKARAEEPRVTCTTVAVFAVDGELECLPASLVLDHEAGRSTLEPVPVRAQAQRDRVDYRSVMGELVITRDIELPGLSGVGVRMIPSRSAIAGSPAPVVLIPRFVGTGWYGAEVVASF